MAKGFRPQLIPPSHRHVEREGRRPYLCLGLSLAATLLVVMVFGVSGYNLYKNRFSRNSLDLEFVQEASLDDLSDDFSSTFCNSYKVSSTDHATLYLLDGDATVNETFRDTINFNKNPSFLSKKYILKHSVINISSCRVHGRKEINSYMVLIKGITDRINYWRKHPCPSCIIVPIPLCDEMQIKENAGKISYTTPSTEFYFLIIVSSETMDFNGTLSRTHYDIHNARIKCNVSRDTSCQFDLPWQSNDDIVLQFPESLEKSKMYTECQLRLVFWVAIFIAIPVSILLPVFLLLSFHLCRVKEKTFNAMQQQARVKRRWAEEKRPLVCREVITDDSYGTTIQTDDT